MSEALLVPDRCRFLHKEQMDTCKSYVYWHNIAKEVRTKSGVGSRRNKGQLVWERWFSGSNVQPVASTKSSRGHRAELYTHSLISFTWRQFHLHSEILTTVHTSLTCLLHSRWCQAVTPLHFTYNSFFAPVDERFDKRQGGCPSKIF